QGTRAPRPTWPRRPAPLHANAQGGGSRRGRPRRTRRGRSPIRAQARASQSCSRTQVPQYPGARSAAAGPHAAAGRSQTLEDDDREIVAKLAREGAAILDERLRELLRRLVGATQQRGVEPLVALELALAPGLDGPGGT